jgi:Tol biopolymer transport system component/Zn-dependent protease with chaperone function
MRPIQAKIITALILILVTSTAVFTAVPAQTLDESTPVVNRDQSADAGWGQMSPEERERATAYSNTKNILYFVGTGFSLAVLLLILFTGLSARMRDWAMAIGRKRFPALVVYLLFFLLLTTLLELPISFYSGYLLEHKYGLSNHTVGSWLWDLGKSLLIGWVLAVVAVAVLYALIRKYNRGWWAWFGIGSVPFIIFIIVIAPIVFMPMFYTITPMEDSPLKTRVLDLAAEGGIADPEIFVMDASKDTKKLNAMVTGLGDTKRIIFYDNTLVKMADDEILFVVAHEMAHYLLHHIWIIVLIASASILLFCFLTNLMIRPIIKRFSRQFGFARLSDFASFPLIMIFISVFSFVFSPITNGVWRHFEHQSDKYGMDRTGDGEAAARAFEKLAAVNLSNPNPSPFIEFWLYDHPTLADRVNFVRSYRPESRQTDPLRVPGERHLKNLRQLTFGGQNAEAYFSADGTELVFQSTRDTMGCDQIFTMTSAGDNVRLVSTGAGVTTCAFFAPSGDRLIFSSTHLGASECPPKPAYDQGYVWPLYADYDVFSADPDGGNLRRLTDAPGYDAEAVYAPDGSSILFTSVRDGDLELYVMDPEGGNVRRLTHQIGYDGGAFFSPDGKRIVYRAFHPQEPEAVAEYQELLAQNMVRPSQMEIFVMDADGTNRHQVTRNGAANFCPYFHPDGQRIIFASNMDDPEGRNFELYLVNVDGTGLERITYNDTFDGFPMFSRDGARLVFASNRNNQVPRETNIFIADWVE